MTIDDDTRAAWLAWRNEGIGASEIAAVCGVSPWRSPLSVYLRKTGELTDDEEPSEAMRLGLRLENALADEFTARTGLYVVGAQEWCQHPEYPWARCTVDGFAAEHPDEDNAERLGVVEIKTTGFLSDYEPLPEHVYMQVQWQLFVTELEHAWVAVLGAGFRGMGFRVLPVERDEPRITAMVKAGASFWHGVERGEPPAVTAYSPGDRDDLAAAYPEPEPGSVVDLGEEGSTLVDELRGWKADAATLAAYIETNENALKALLGDREAGTVDGETVVTWKATETTRVDVKRLRAEDPDLAKRYGTTTTARRFLVK